MNATLLKIKTLVKSKLELMGDLTVWLVLFALSAISSIEVYSASSRDTYGEDAFWATGIHHTGFLLAGVLVAWIVSKIHCKHFKWMCALGLLVSIVMLLAIACGFGVTLNSGTRWISVFGLFTIQPSEITKCTLVGTVAMLFGTFRDAKTQEVSKKAFWIAIGLSAFVALMIMSENLSTAALLSFVVFLMCLYCRVPKKQFLIVVFSFSIFFGSLLSFLYFASDATIEKVVELTGKVQPMTWHNRMVHVAHLPADPAEYEYDSINIQVTHSHIAIASGGVFGLGPGQSIQRDYLPMAFSDFIYAIVVEEGGVCTGFIVLSLYFLLLYRTYRIASRCKQRFPAYLVMGLALMIVIQAMINMSVAVCLLPVTGQPLPLMSKGGTSTLLTCIYVGMILSVSHTAKQKPEEDFVKENIRA